MTTQQVVTVTLSAQVIRPPSDRLAFALTYTDRGGEVVTEEHGQTSTFHRLRALAGQRELVDGFTFDQLRGLIDTAATGVPVNVPRNDLPPYGPHLCPDSCGVALIAPNAPGEAGDDTWYCGTCARSWTLDLAYRTQL